MLKSGQSRSWTRVAPKVCAKINNEQEKWRPRRGAADFRPPNGQRQAADRRQHHVSIARFAWECEWLAERPAIWLRRSVTSESFVL